VTAVGHPVAARHGAAGLAVIGLLSGAAFALGSNTPAISPLLWALALGLAVAPAVRKQPQVLAQLSSSGSRLLRVGVALLGVQISLDELAGVGVRGVALAAGTVAVTLLLTLSMGRLLRVPDRLALLIATGSAICGASAIVAINTVARANQAEVAYAIATVTIFGTVVMLTLPPLAGVLALSNQDAGLWAGASIHEVAQVTAAGAVISTAALKAATLVKLARVAMLAPVVALSAAARRGEGDREAIGLPPFLVAFLALCALRSMLPLPDALLDGARVVSTALLAAALVALGLQLRPGEVRRAGARPLALGAVATAAALITGLAGVLLQS
jgi:uncharacterized integral membrane protein (TIGR00698 family)